MDQYPITPISRIAYLSFEDPIGRNQDRFLDSLRDEDLILYDGFIIYPTELTITTEENRAYIELLIQDTKPDVLFIDTYQKATTGLLSYDDKEQSIILHWLVNLTRKYDVAIIVLDHVSNDAARRLSRTGHGFTMFDAKGTGGKIQNADCVITLQRDGLNRIKFTANNKDSGNPETCFFIEITPMGDTSKPKFIYAGNLKNITEGKQLQRKENRITVLDAVGSDPMSSKEILSKVPTVKRTAGIDLIKDLVNKGEIKQKGKGKNTRYWRPSVAKSTDINNKPKSSSSGIHTSGDSSVKKTTRTKGN